MAKIIEFIIYSDRHFEQCPLEFQNVIYLLLDKFKKEKKKIKIDSTKPIGKAIREDSLVLLKLPIVSSKEKSDFIIKIFDYPNTYQNDGINIILNNEKVIIKRLKP